MAQSLASTLQDVQSIISNEAIPLVSMDTRHGDNILPGKRQPTWRQGHHFGMRCCALAVAMVLLINVLILIVVASTNKVVDGIVKFKDGDCAAPKRLTIGLHLLINLFGTTLLGASNYCMQCVSAPTRKDIDKAHRQHIWMDIGISSIRNLKRLSWPRKAIWSLLFVSSLPLHLTYNSVVFSSTSTVNYGLHLVTKDFLGSNVPVGKETMLGQQLTGSPGDEITHLRDVKDSLTDMEYKDCMNVFNQRVVSNWKDFLVVSSYEGTGIPIIDTNWPNDGYDNAQQNVVCSSSPGVYCSNEAWSAANGNYPTTAGNCLAPKARFAKASTWAALPLQYQSKKQKWFVSASRKRWLLTTASYIVVLLGLTSLLGYITLIHGFTQILSFGFGSINTNQAIGSYGIDHASLLGMVLLANTPQIVLTFLYFAFNNLYTCMLLAKEWSEYAVAPRALRVTAPIGEQLSSYRLNLPYRFGVPLLAVSILLHWLVSETIYVVNLDVYNSNNEFVQTINDCGYSPTALLTTTVVGAVILLIGIAHGFRRYESGIPLVGTCSAAISASCHPPAGDDRPSIKLIMWGSCGHADGIEAADQSASAQDGEVGHCSMTSLTVERPVEGALYAGLPRRSNGMSGVGSSISH